jgi:hypothetical protein
MAAPGGGLSDPGTGSYMLQLLNATGLGSDVLDQKEFWKKSHSLGSKASS